MNKLPIFNYKISNQGNERLDVFIDGIIVDAETQEIYENWFGDTTSVSFKSFRTQVLDSGIKNISITINSFGGQIGDAMAMHDFIQQLESQGYDIETIGIGMVCSAATFILSASKKSKISKNAYYMIHNVSGGVWGDVNEIERYAKALRDFNNNIRDFYVNLTGKSAQEIENLMNAETWYYGEQVKNEGFVKEVISNQNPTNEINKKDWMFKNEQPMVAYNSFVPKVPVNTEDNLIQNLDMNKIVEAIVNAFKAKNLVVTDAGQNAEPLTAENLTGALNEAFKGIDLEPKAPTDEQVNNALTEFFKNGLPENMISQITNAVKENVKPENFKDSEEWKGVENRLKDIEDKAAKNFGQAKPKNSGGSGESKYDKEDIGFSGE